MRNENRNKCYIIGRCTCFNLWMTFHLLCKRPLQFRLTGGGVQTVWECPCRVVKDTSVL